MGVTSAQICRVLFRALVFRISAHEIREKQCVATLQISNGHAAERPVDFQETVFDGAWERYRARISRLTDEKAFIGRFGDFQK